MNQEQMDIEYPKVNMFELLRGLTKSAVRMLVPAVVLMALLAGMLCLRTWWSYTPVYQASASFTVNTRNPFYATQQYYNNNAAEQMAKTFPQILTSGLLSDRVKEELGIPYMPAINASAIGETNIFSLTVSSPDPALAYDVLNCVMRVYPDIAEFVIGSTELTLLSESGLPAAPSNSPDYFGAAAKGITVGAAIWIGISLLYWLTHRTVTSEEDLNRLVNLPCLGYLPWVRGTEKGSCPVVRESNDKFGFNESVRLLRVRVEKALAEEQGNVLLVTSTIPNEGKTTVSVNLAAALAQKGKQVLLVDCDLRNPSIGQIFGVQPRKGFAEYLRGECKLAEITGKMSIPNLHIVFGSKGVRDAGRLLSQQKAKELIETARKNFDYVILDTPPSAMMADASDVAMLADAALLTVRYDFAARQQIREAVQNLSDTDTSILGTVFNMATPQQVKGGYGYGYGYGYGTYGSYGSGKGTKGDRAK